MTDAEKNRLRADVNEYFRQQESAPEVPLPAAANRAALTPAQQETLFQNWVEYILSTPSNTWGPAEKNAVRVASSRALKELRG